MMGKRLEKFSEVGIVDETNGFGVDFVEKTEWLWSGLCREDRMTLSGLCQEYREWI